MQNKFFILKTGVILVGIAWNWQLSFKAKEKNRIFTLILANGTFQITYGDFQWVDNQSRKQNNRNVNVLFNQFNFNESSSN